MLKLAKFGIFGIFAMLVVLLIGFISSVSAETKEISENSAVTISCPSGQLVESFSSRFYCPDGRENTGCSVYNGGLDRGFVTVWFTNDNCGGDPCPGVAKRGSLTAQCSGSSSGVSGEQPQQTCTDNGQRNWGDCDAVEPNCGQTTTGRQSAVDNCGNVHYKDCTKEGNACPAVTTPPANAVYLGSVGGVGDSACRNAGGCIEIQTRNSNGVFERVTYYSCSDNIGSSGYWAICAGTGGEQPISGAGPTVSGPVAGTPEGQPAPTSTSTQLATVTITTKRGDFDNDNDVDNDDLLLLLDQINSLSYSIKYDLNSDNVVNENDFDLFGNIIWGLEGLDCSTRCKNNGLDAGSCFAEDGTKPQGAEREYKYSFLGMNFGNLGCSNEQGCYCYNPVVEELPGPSGSCSDGIKNQDETDIDCGGVCGNANKCEINKRCLADSDCYSGFCNEVATRCVDECYAKSLSQCKSDNKCIIKSGYKDVPEADPNAVCVNKVGDAKLVDEMSKITFSGNDPGTEYDALIAIKKIMEDYNINYGEYVSAWERENSKLGAGISSPVFSGQAVRINAADEGCPDFVSDGTSKGIVDYDDFFRFIDEFGKSVSRENEKFDLEKDQYNIIGLGDFFKFADNFGKEVECFTATCNDNEANLPGEIRVGDYSCGGECGSCEFNELRKRGAEPINVVNKQGECEGGICTFKLKAVGRYQGRGNLNVNIRGDDYNDKTFLIRITGTAVRKISNLLTGLNVFDITGFAADDAVYQDVTKPSTGKSRFECGLQLNPGFCCPAGYATSSDGSRCVLAESVMRYCADFNTDNRVDFIDYFYLADNFGAGVGDAGYDARVDLDNNGRIDFDDFFLFADKFGEEPEC